jgi:Leucine-rich repeat (LRR) protein
MLLYSIQDNEKENHEMEIEGLFYRCGRNMTCIEKLPEHCRTFNCAINSITKIENLPDSLIEFDCQYNKITRIENLPESLKVFMFDDNPIQFVDNLGIDEYKSLFGEFVVQDYTNIKKCTRIIKNWHILHETAARVITRGCHNWIWKPFCNDGTIGIRPRLDMQELGIKLL